MGAEHDDEQSMSLNGCDAESYVDRSAAEAERVVHVGADGLKFTPSCMRIAAGQRVRFEGSLTAHPLAPGTPDDPGAGSPHNPIERTSSGASLEVAFDEPGTYPYYCELHGFGSGMGMVGVISVR
jgi:plastocyanin